MAGVFLAYGFVVDIDLLWSVAGEGEGEGDIAQFDFVASAVTGQRVLRVIVECKGGDRWGYGDAFQLLGQLRMIGEDHAILLAAQRRSLDRQSRTASSMNRWFAPFGLHVLTVPIDDHPHAAPVIDIDAVGQALFAQGLVPLPNPKLRMSPFTGVPEIRSGQLMTGSDGSQGFPVMAPRIASSAVMPWVAAESR
jgi:hypothetical protein